MTDQRPDIDIEAETEQFRKFFANAPVTGKFYCWRTWKARARLAAERERSLLDLLREARKAVCSLQCPSHWPMNQEQPHSRLCLQITEALKPKGPSE